MKYIFNSLKSNNCTKEILSKISKIWKKLKKYIKNIKCIKENKIQNIKHIVFNIIETNKILNRINKFVKNNFSEIMKYSIVAIIVVLGATVGSYKPLYMVTYNGQNIGCVTSKANLDNKIKKEILTVEEENAVAKDLNAELEYEFKWGKFEKSNIDEILQILANNTTTTYRMYAININNEAKSYVNTWKEAEKIVEDMQLEYKDLANTEITVTEKYTEDLNVVQVEELAMAEANINNNLRQIKDEQEEIAKSTFNGIYFAVKPVTGKITSRFGAVESIRNHVHQGIDIGAPNGTPIKAAAGGKIIQAGYYGGYGNLIIIDHGNCVKTYYAHCSRISVSVGQEVKAGDVIGAVGSTGHSTGNHLHFEIRLDEQQVNPETYVYR